MTMVFGGDFRQVLLVILKGSRGRRRLVKQTMVEGYNKCTRPFESDDKHLRSIDKTKRGVAIDESVFSPKFINGLKFSGVPNHILALKVGVPIMLLRNIDQENGLCNGTRLQVLKLTRTSIQAQIINGTHFEKKVIIPRLRITPYDKRLPLKIVRKQYPLSLSFAMTINKSQGQSLSKVGLYLSRPVFTHGQLYVALSRVKSKRGLKVVVCDDESNVSKTTTNVVYKEVLHEQKDTQCLFNAIEKIIKLQLLNLKVKRSVAMAVLKTITMDELVNLELTLKCSYNGRALHVIVNGAIVCTMMPSLISGYAIVVAG
ncbi:ATP-dependent DNA helicase PIF1-like protein [Tanacetum coccineum]